MIRQTLLLLLAVLLTATVANATPAPASAAGANCVAWDRAHSGLEKNGRASIDRLAPDRPYGQLLNAWRADNCMRLNQVQVLGTHNSYHVAPRPPLLSLIGSFDPNAALSMDYTHRPLAEQLGDLGVRQLELDVFADPSGALFATPLGELPPFGGVEPLPLGDMLAPGLKVLHIQDIDYRTQCRAFVACLGQIKAWSDANPDHLPVMVLIEAKDDPLALPPSPPLPPLPWPPATPVAFGAAELDAIDASIRSVFEADQLMTPDDVRGHRATLEEAVLKDGWPTLNELRGRVFFAFDNTDLKRDAYIAGHPSLQGRVMFTSSDPGTSEAAFLKMNDPLADLSTIQGLVAQGYLVRTRADADTVEARLGETERRDAALASGAQFVSTDYPEPNPAFATDYVVDIPGGAVGRCNPVLSPPTCDSTTFER